jgi:hypothetical protein
MLRALTTALALTLALATLTVVSSCGSSDSPSPKPAARTPIEADTTAAVTPAPRAPAEPAGADVEIVCYSNDNSTDITGTPADMEAFWARKLTSCFDSTSTGTPSPLEQKALKTAYPKDPDVDPLSTLYGICAENDKKWGNYIRTAGSPDQLREMAGALVLCPNHPQKAKVAKFVKIAEGNNTLEAQGRIFYDGTYRVGKKIAPGTYFAEPRGDKCYWERTDAAGNIIDNNFSSGLRVEMTVRSSDYSVRVDGCGKWQPVR